MCGRYSLFADPHDVARLFHTQLLEEEFNRRYNAAPSQSHPVIINDDGKRTMQLMRWGLIPRWAKEPSIGYKMFNARADTLTEKTSFKKPLQNQRCIVPADGFYEWKTIGKEKRPLRASLKSGEPFAMAGLWEHWMNKETGEIINSFTVITTEPNETMRPIHNRMPVILLPHHVDMWLDKDIPAEELLQLLNPYPDEEMKVEPVSKKLNKAGFDDPCVLIPDGDEPEDLTMF